MLFALALYCTSGGWRLAFGFGRFVVFWVIVVVAVVGAMRRLWWGLTPAISAPMRVLLVPMGLALAALVAGIADKVCLVQDCPRYQAGLRLLAVGALLLTSPLRVGMTDWFRKWQASVCMAAGRLAAGMGAVICLFPGPVRPGTGMELLGLMLWKVTRWTLVFLWSIAPGVEVALASLFGYAVVSRLLQRTPVVRVNTQYCRFALVLISFCVGLCWGRIPPVDKDLAAAVMWLLGLVLIHLYLRAQFDQASPLPLFLTCAMSTVAWTALVATAYSSDVWYPTLKLVFPVVWACDLCVVLIPVSLKLRRDYIASRNDAADP